MDGNFGSLDNPPKRVTMLNERTHKMQAWQFAFALLLGLLLLERGNMRLGEAGARAV
jgi:hypothetical protein